MLASFLMVFAVLLSSVTMVLSQNRCTDIELLPGDENLLEYGLDSTSHWWAVTSPFTDRFRLYINGKKFGDFLGVQKPQFSDFEGKQWGVFVQQNNGLWDAIIDDSLYSIQATEPREISFSTNSKTFAIGVMRSGMEEVTFQKSVYAVINRVSKLIVSPEGRRVAYVLQQGALQSLYVNGKEIETFQEIKIIGFFYDGSIVFCARQGNQWNVFKNSEQISNTYQSIKAATINRFGTTVALGAQQLNNESVLWVFSEEYNQPIQSQPFDVINSISLHPSKPIIMAECNRGGQSIVTIQFTEMGGGLSNSKPHFTLAGEQYYFMSCENICSMVIDGVRRTLNTNFVFNEKFAVAVKPNGKTFAISSLSSVVVRYIESNELYAGMILNSMKPTRYNWRTDRYEALGSIQNRLYMIMCKTE